MSQSMLYRQMGPIKRPWKGARLGRFPSSQGTLVTFNKLGSSEYLSSPKAYGPQLGRPQEGAISD